MVMDLKAPGPIKESEAVQITQSQENVFSAVGKRIDLIFLREGQSSWDTSLDTQQQVNRNNLKI